MTILERKEREFKQREDQILAAALSLFNCDEWQTVTIDQIAAKAEIGKGTIYKHFESKDQIYAKLVVRFHAGIVAELRKIDFTQVPMKVLGDSMDVFWRFHGSSPEHKRLIRYCRREDFRRVIGPEISKQLEDLDEQIGILLDPVMERGIREGSFIDKPIEILILGIHASMVGLMEMEGIECMKTDLTPEQQYREVKEFALRGISKR